MPLKCYNKPNRKKTRVFTARDCGRIACYAIDDGADKADVRAEVEKCTGGDPDCTLAYSLLKFLLALLLAIAVAIAILSRIQAILRVLLKLRDLLPKEVIDYLESPKLQKLEEEIIIRIDEVTELITRKKL